MKKGPVGFGLGVSAERTGKRERTGEEEGGREPVGFDLGVTEDDLFHLLLRPVSSQPPPVHLRPVLVKMEVVIVEGGGDGFRRWRSPMMMMMMVSDWVLF
ncbi:hypothetical protein HanRHA438_Chr00c29g0854781 [Helianthus annuus]|nr:hypothetical protein HanRHA438_Chr00c29g0854781 [Helianthus annuus]